MNKKEIFSTDFSMTLDEYKKMMKLIPKFYWWNVLKASIAEIIIILIISIIYKLSLSTAIIISLITIIFVMILYRIKIEWLAKRYYDYYDKNGMLAKSEKIAFFDNYLIKSSGNIQIKVEYNQINKIIETESNFYICSKNTIGLISKANCELKEEEFIRNINSDVYVRKIKPKKSINEISKNKNDNSVLLKALFYTTIFSFFAAILTIRTVTIETPSALITEKMWVFWLFLPIPISSIIAGYRFKNQNSFAKKNITAGYVISILLIIFGSFFLIMPVGRINHSKIEKYENILMVEIPEEGDFVQQKYGTYFDLDKKNVIVTEAFFVDSLELKNFEQKLLKGENWIEFKKISNELEPWIPYQMLHSECKKCYISIYNEQTKKYNMPSAAKENYIMDVALYDLEKKHLEINTYEVN